MSFRHAIYKTLPFSKSLNLIENILWFCHKFSNLQGSCKAYDAEICLKKKYFCRIYSSLHDENSAADTNPLKLGSFVFCPNFRMDSSTAGLQFEGLILQGSQ